MFLRLTHSFYAGIVLCSMFKAPKNHVPIDGEQPTSYQRLPGNLRHVSMYLRCLKFRSVEISQHLARSIVAPNQP